MSVQTIRIQPRLELKDRVLTSSLIGRAESRSRNSCTADNSRRRRHLQ
jgi:hypothetical protein